MKKNIFKRKLKLVFYSLFYADLMKACNIVGRRCKDSSKIEEKAKNYVIYQYTMTVFLYTSGILVMLDAVLFKITSKLLKTFNIISIYIVAAIFAILFYYLIELGLRKTLFKSLWANVYKHRNFIQGISLLKYRIIEVFLLIIMGLIIPGIGFWLVS